MKIRILLLASCLMFTLGYSYSQENMKTVRAVKNGAAAQTTIEHSVRGISPQTAFLILDLKKLENESRRLTLNDTLLINKYNIKHLQNDFFVNSFLAVTSNFDFSELKKYNVSFNIESENDSIFTALLPIYKIEDLSQVEGIKTIQIAEKVNLQMDIAREKTWVNWVHDGYQLPQSYYGEDVVVGIIDGGFDYTHPNFYNNTGSSGYRVKRVWDQNATSGTPPSNFSYGRELTSQSAILNAQKDINTGSHATHVAGIAAGAGATTDYYGVATKSDLVFVSTDWSDPGIGDGIAYIMNYASSVNKPCVINMSLGKHVGPHDGNSLFDQYCDGVVGAGRLLVGAAGNEGQDYLYNEKTFTSTDNTFYTLVYFPYSSNGTNGASAIDIWGDPGKNYQVAVNVWNSNTNEFEDWTPYLNASSSFTGSYNLYDDDPLFTDLCHVEISTGISSLNNKANTQIYVDHSAQDDNYRWAMIEIQANSGTVRMWAATGNAEFYNAGYGLPLQDGMTKSTVGEIGGTGNSIISVGAYNTTQNTDGDIAPFSSKGPTADNRTKPDITAPGNRITASVNSFDPSYLNGGTSVNDVVTGITDGTNSWRFAQMQGTSMASPMVTGILALWLEAYPYLTPNQAKKLLKDNAWKDNFTGNITPNGNGSNTWGWGKVDAHEGIKDLLTKIPPKPTIQPSQTINLCQGESTQLTAPNGYSAYLWSNNAETSSINVSTSGNYSVCVMNSNGFISPWSDPRVVNVHPNPPVPTITVNGNTLTSSANSGNQWYFNGNIIQGATQKNYTAQQSGNYSVKVTNANNCSSQSSNISVTISTSGISDLEKVGITAVYPNPTEDIVNIQFSENQENVNLEVYDMSGRLLFNKHFNSVSQNQKEQISLYGVASGMYTLKISNNSMHGEFKIMVSK